MIALLRSRWLWRGLVLAALIGALLATAMWLEARSDPIVRRATIAMPQWPADAPPMRVLFLTDIHVAGPDMPPERLGRIVEQANALRPDLVLIGGDFVSDKRVATHAYTMAEAITPLGGLDARFGVIAVAGNHDHWRSHAEFSAALAEAGILLLENAAVRRGALTVIGADDFRAGRTDIDALARAAAALPGPALLLAHNPDIIPELPSDFRLVLAGHTHCGQIAVPLLGRPVTMSRYDERYACGIIRENGRTIVVGAGLGTSLLPIRFRAPPDMWLLTLGPRR